MDIPTYFIRRLVVFMKISYFDLNFAMHASSMTQAYGSIWYKCTILQLPIALSLLALKY